MEISFKCGDDNSATVIIFIEFSYKYKDFLLMKYMYLLMFNRASRDNTISPIVSEDDRSITVRYEYISFALIELFYINHINA